MAGNPVKLHEYFYYKPYDAIHKLVFFRHWNKVVCELLAVARDLVGNNHVCFPVPVISEVRCPVPLSTCRAPQGALRTCLETGSRIIDGKATI
jgi:hypothetical protein